MASRSWQHPLAVRQAWASSGICSYLIVCGRTRAAALVDPHPDTRPTLQEWLDDPGLKLRLELHTRSSDHPVGAQRARRLDALVRRIGLSTRTGKPSAPPPRWEALPRTRVMPRVGDAPPGRMQLQVGDAVLEVPTAGGAGAPYTVVGRPVGPLSLHVDRVRIAFGAHHIEVIGIGTPPGVVGYLVQDRLFFGGSLRAGARGSLEDATPERLLELDPDVVLYPAHAPGEIGVSTVLQERRWASHGVRAATVASPSALEDDQLLDDLSGIDLSMTPLVPSRRANGDE